MTDKWAHYCLVIHQHGHLARLMVAARTENVIDQTPINARAPHWDDARAEAQKLYPDRQVVVLSLGEPIPPAKETS